jgi:pantetheine-phosphate adenylyltransferase
MKTSVFPGTFDPITKGHIDIIERAVTVFDRVIVAIAVNSAKKPLFSAEERVELVRCSVSAFPSVEVATCDGLLVDFALAKGASVIIRGLRAVSDFEYEYQMALMNRKLAPGISTMFLMPDEQYSFINSTIIRELAAHHADVSRFVPACVAQALKNIIGNGPDHISAAGPKQ